MLDIVYRLAGVLVNPPAMIIATKSVRLSVDSLVILDVLMDAPILAVGLREVGQVVVELKVVHLNASRVVTLIV